MLSKKRSPKNREKISEIVTEIENLQKNNLINSYLGNKGYTIYKVSLTNKIIEFIKSELTVKPFLQTSIIEAPSFPVYQESDKKIYLPRMWGIELFGNPNSIKIAEGENKNFTLLK